LGQVLKGRAAATSRPIASPNAGQADTTEVK
jgi:hypothetical protein